MNTWVTLKRNIFEMLVLAWPFRKGQTRWYDLVAKLLKIEPYHSLKLKQMGQYRLRLDPGDENDHLYYFDIVGHANALLVRAILRPGDRVIDVGANIGHFAAICAAQVGNRGQVHSIEASPSLYKRLLRSVSEVPQGPIRLYDAAVWSSPGSITFHIATNSGWSSLLQNETFNAARSIQVKSITLDDLIKQQDIGHVRLLKLDIEGAETEALLGTREALENAAIDLVLIEAEPQRLRAFGRTGADIDNLMEGHKYDPVAYITANKVLPISKGMRIPGTFNGDYLYAYRSLAQETTEALFGK